MANELSKFAEWTFMQECSVPKDVMNMMVNGEQPYAAFKTVRDVAVFTNFRLVFAIPRGSPGKDRNVLAVVEVRRHVVFRECRNIRL